jgi:hypothetical protein
MPVARVPQWAAQPAPPPDAGWFAKLMHFLSRPELDMTPSPMTAMRPRTFPPGLLAEVRARMGRLLQGNMPPRDADPRMLEQFARMGRQQEPQIGYNPGASVSRVARDEAMVEGMPLYRSGGLDDAPRGVSRADEWDQPIMSIRPEAQYLDEMPAPVPSHGYDDVPLEDVWRPAPAWVDETYGR